VPRKLLISVIDDDESFRTALVEFLRSLGYSGHGFASAEDFMAGQGDISYDCAITDLQMPGMSGFELTQLLSARGFTAPVIMITARAELGLEVKAAASGAVHLLRKPFETDVLIDCIERAAKRQPLIH
jgi:FixJ family two-component response regulator